MVIILPAGGPGWTDIVTAAATGALALLTFLTAVFAGFALKAQSRQLRIEQGERKREAKERREAQAVQVYVWQKVDPAAQPVAGSAGGKVVQATLVNSSKQPVYEVKIGWMTDGVLRDITFREEPLKPDEEQSAIAGVAWDDDPMAIAFFRDRAGLSWSTYADGRLAQVVGNSEPTIGFWRKLIRCLRSSDPNRGGEQITA